MSRRTGAQRTGRRAAEGVERPGRGRSEDTGLLELVRRAVKLGAGGRRGGWILVVTLAVVVSVFEAVGAVLIFALLRLITSSAKTFEVPLLGDIRSHLGGADDTRVYTTAAAVVAVFFVVRGLVVVLAAYVQARVTQGAGARLSSRLQRGYLAMPYSLYVGANSSTQIRNVNGTVQRLVSDVFVQGAKLVSEAVVMVVLGSVLVVASPPAALLLVIVMTPAVLVLNHFVNPPLTRLGAEAQRLEGESLRLLQESLHGLRDIRLVGREGYFLRGFAGSRYRLGRNRVLRSVLQQIPTAAVETMFVLFITLFLVFTVSTGRRAADILPVLGMFAYVGLRLKPSLNQVIASVNGIRFSGPSINDLHEDLGRADGWLAGDQPGAAPLRLEREIRLRRVSFRYEGAVDLALRDVDLTIARGQSVGFVGPTGGGKSTLIDVLVGLLDPQAGQVLVDGADIRDAKRQWRALLGVVPQSIFLIDDTLRRNIALGEDRVDEPRLMESVRMAQLDSFLVGLPDGLDTVLGERGVRVSGGERQRIGIARAVYRQPAVLVLDEGTSALDNKTEAELMAAVEQLRGAYTLVLVAHRLTTVENCDQIFVVDDGRVVAVGDDQTLLAASEQLEGGTTP